MCNRYFSDIYQDPEPEFIHIPCQGDIFSKDALKLDVENPENISGWMIVNAACDLVTRKVDFFCFVPIRTLNYYIENNKNLKRDKLKQYVDNIINYRIPKTFFLPATSRFDEKFNHYCELQYLFSVGLGDDFDGVCSGLIQFRLASLKSPWREKLGNLLGNNFSRIGVPNPKEGYKETVNEIISRIKSSR